MARPKLICAALVACACALTFAPAAALAQDSDAPEGADPSWLPNEEWVNLLWLPFDEQRLEALLKMTRGDIFRHVRIDATNTLAQLGKRRGYSVDELAAKLVAPQRDELGERKFRELRDHARRVVSQGHMAQHFLFHALHQTAVPARAREIFGVHDRQQFLELRRAEISPLQIGELHGKLRVDMRRAAEKALRDAATRGVDKGMLSAKQRRIMLDRQLRQLPRWLGQSRYNGPTAGANRPDLPPGDQAKRPSITADGSRVVWDAYRSTISEAERQGEIHVQLSALPYDAISAVNPAVKAGSRRPYSAYNSTISADGSAVVYETAQSTFPLAKRVGQMSVFVRDLAAGTAPQRISHVGLPAGAPTRSAFNPTISDDGRRIVFEATDTAAGRGDDSRNGLWLFDRATQTQTLVAEHGPTGAAFLPRISGDGRAVAYTDVDDGGVTQVLVRALGDRATTLVSRADGAAGAPAAGDAYEPAIARDGSVVAFTSRAVNLGASGNRSRVFVRDLRAGTTRLVSAGAGGDAISPAISADGRHVVFVARKRSERVVPRNLRATVWVFDRVTGATTLISRRSGADGAAADRYSSEPAISADGARVVFTSTAGNLSERKAGGLAGIFLRDIAAARTTLLSDPGSATAVVRADAPATSLTRASAPSSAYICPLEPWHDADADLDASA